ncbi:MAG TPA: FAD-binding protein [Bacteroidales bacterium]|nr:FAD-binding protein [Bacteroidales bacterium]HPR73732.1 FAD-binding protein [Bacteroidales bacterium]
MPVRVQIVLEPEAAADMDNIRRSAAKVIKADPDLPFDVRIVKRSVDARQRRIKVLLTVDLFTHNEIPQQIIRPFEPENVSGAREVLIAGAGPAGLFAALRLIELGIKPVIFERGRVVSHRKRDIARISREHIVDPDSNYCFGEGGAGTFSDGKLYTRSKKRGDNFRALELLCHFGADKSILYEAHPHLGTDKLPGIISSVRKAILDAGGEIFFERRINNILTENKTVKGVLFAGNEKYLCNNLILATGHSARDVYDICRSAGITLVMKPFAMGVRVEHPQVLIDKIRYHGNERGKYLPAASYNIVRQVDGRGVYSFCMCPGGYIVPSATSSEEVVVNGMSPSGRSSPFANSGIVVEIKPGDLAKYQRYGELAGIMYQKDMEKDAWINGGRSQRAPAQRLADFVNGTFSSSLPSVSYFPGVTSSPLHEWLPPVLYGRLKEGFRLFGSAMKGWLTNEAVILGVESRTSSPVRIPRDPQTMENIDITGLYPCGEGSGYAGGIISSAVDGMRTAEAVAAGISCRV